ncbi:GNAT family N-acetyltransferase [Henriciella sp. AS95]|uniref:GNAT family N-acetyltransferase n=1 Tax=Henriciella sp. AS95 TaxID=3135782 RepID=UPI00316B5C02
MPDTDATDLVVRDATPDDLQAIAALSRKTFCDKFAHLYRREDLDAFLEESHSEAFYRPRLGRADLLIRVAESADGDLGAYLLCGPLSLPAKDPAPGAVELKRLYVDEPLQGQGLGTRFAEEAFVWAKAQGAPQMFLSVFSENHGAQRLYHRMGFEKVDEFWFPVGEHRDLEYLMCWTRA